MSTLETILVGLKEAGDAAGKALSLPEVRTSLLAAATATLSAKLGSAVWKRFELRRRRHRKREQCKRSFDSLEKSLKDNQMSHETQQAISKLSLSELIDQLQTGQLIPSDVLYAYQIQALDAHKKTNCVTEPIMEAELRAKELDLAEEKGPLHGVPVSIKENYSIQGYDVTMGCSSQIGLDVPEDSVVVKVLKKQGAVPFVRTNLPQTMMVTDCSNPIFGQTTNPKDSSRSPGGSSGGEGALIGGGGSPLGIGSDIGGSIRLPAHYCGICGIKLTYNRISHRGVKTCMSGQPAVRPNLGPMARDVDSLALALKALLVPAMFDLDNTVPPIPFRDEIYEGRHKLRVGYYRDDGFCTSTPTCRRAVDIAKQKLEKLGHELVPVDINQICQDAFGLYAKSVCADRAQTMAKILSGDVIDSTFRANFMIFKLWASVKSAISYMIKPFWPHVAHVIYTSQPVSSIADYYKFMNTIDKVKQDMESLWRRHGIDVLLAPGGATPALKLGLPGKLTNAHSYFVMYNLLNLPGGSLPVTTVTQEDHDAMADYPMKDIWHYLIKKNSEGSVGLPVGVQILSKPYQEELCLRVMKELETALKDEEQ